MCRLALWVAGATALVTGCSAGGSPPSDFCKSVDALASAVTQINQSSLNKSTVSAVESSLATLGAAVDNLVQTAEPEFADEVEAVEAAAIQVDQTVGAAVDRPTASSLDAARTSMRDFTTVVKDLDQSTSESC